MRLTASTAGPEVRRLSEQLAEEERLAAMQTVVAVDMEDQRQTEQEESDAAVDDDQENSTGTASNSNHDDSAEPVDCEPDTEATPVSAAERTSPSPSPTPGNPQTISFHLQQHAAYHFQRQSSPQVHQLRVFPQHQSSPPQPMPYHHVHPMHFAMPHHVSPAGSSQHSGSPVRIIAAAGSPHVSPSGSMHTGSMHSLGVVHSRAGSPLPIVTASHIASPGSSSPPVSTTTSPYHAPVFRPQAAASLSPSMMLNRQPQHARPRVSFAPGQTVCFQVTPTGSPDGTQRYTLSPLSGGGLALQEQQCFDGAPDGFRRASEASIASVPAPWGAGPRQHHHHQHGQHHGQHHGHRHGQHHSRHHQHQQQQHQQQHQQQPRPHHQHHHHHHHHSPHHSPHPGHRQHSTSPHPVGSPFGPAHAMRAVPAVRRPGVAPSPEMLRRR
jgi:hypothetical protein